MSVHPTPYTFNPDPWGCTCTLVPSAQQVTQLSDAGRTRQKTLTYTTAGIMHCSACKACTGDISGQRRLEAAMAISGRSDRTGSELHQQPAHAQLIGF